MQARRIHPVLTLLIALAATSCASAGSTGGGGGDPDRITSEDLANLQSSNAYEVVQRLRPRWLRSRDVREQVRVAVNGTPRGPLEELRRINLADIAEMRYLDAREATTKYGVGYGAGVIEVTTR